MVWDYNDREPGYTRWQAEQRFIPLRALAYYNIPHCVWGNDALTCHEVPMCRSQTLEVLVPSDELQTAASRLLEHLESFKQQRTLNLPHEADVYLRDGYKDDCICLESPKRYKFGAKYILLIPDEAFCFDTRDTSRTQDLPSEFKLGSEFDNIKIPTHSAYVDALIATCRTKYHHRLMIYALDAVLSMLVAWKLRFPIEELYQTPDEFPLELREIRDGLNQQNIPGFEYKYSLRQSSSCDSQQHEQKIS